MTASGTIYFLTYDQVGSLRLIIDNTGNSVKRIDYDSFGNIISDSNPSFVIPFGFAGGLHDQDTGLVRFGYRDYIPEIGKWTAKDPILFAGGDANLYGYVENDPVNYTDYLGLWRSHPRYGNWGGADWSGGDSGKEAPVDSMDECFKQHDNDYDSCGTTKKDADQALVKCLYKLPKNPLNWPRRPNDPIHADFYRSWALGYF